MTPLRWLLVLSLLLFVSPVLAEDCRDCHDCDKPTPEDPCLPECSRDIHPLIWKDFLELQSPDTCVIDILEDLYEPVIFDHQQHARMSGMGGSSCRLCHHENGDHEVQRCVECHPVTLQAGEGLTVPGLKTAYHRQCMFCHKEWSHETDCEICHAHKGGERKQPSSMGLGNGREMHHKPLPERVLFTTSHEDAPYVSFDHVEHAENYGLSCASCHSQDNCASCHDERNIVNGRHLHSYSNRSTCTQCHQVGRCVVCHATTPDRRFSHSLTGFPMRSFHADLACARCHEAEHSHGWLSHDCDDCHGEWDTDSFDHATKLGVDLGEDHEGMDCGDCHPDPAFLDAPVCGDCHDDDREGDLLK